MPITYTTVYGDTDLAIDGHDRGGNQTLAPPNYAHAPWVVVGDAHALAGHAAGGNDVVTASSPNQSVAIGDANIVTEHARGGNDTVLATAQFDATALGDAETMSAHAQGGDDSVMVRSDFSARAFGDALVLGDHARGGDDTVSGTSGHGAASLYGDANYMDGHAAGGDDLIQGVREYSATMIGDAQVLSGYARGGNDTLVAASHGGDLNSFPVVNRMYGDGLELRGYASGGDDVLISGANNHDQMWGDAATIDPTAGTGADLFVFAPFNGQDQIMDFQSGKDLIELKGLGFASFQDLAGHIQDTPDGALISMDSTNSILVSHVAALNAADFIFG